MPGEYARTDGREARIRANLAKAHLRIGDAGGYDAALNVLLQVALGRNEKNEPIKIPARTRAIAAKELLKAANATAPPPTSEGPSVTINQDNRKQIAIHAPSDPAQERALMAGFAQAVIESEGVIPDEEPAVVEEADPADEPA